MSVDERRDERSCCSVAGIRSMRCGRVIGDLQQVGRCRTKARALLAHRLQALYEAVPLRLADEIQQLVVLLGCPFEALGIGAHGSIHLASCGDGAGGHLSEGAGLSALLLRCRCTSHCVRATQCRRFASRGAERADLLRAADEEHVLDFLELLVDGQQLSCCQFSLPYPLPLLELVPQRCPDALELLACVAYLPADALERFPHAVRHLVLAPEQVGASEVDEILVVRVDDAHELGAQRGEVRAEL